MTARGRPGVSRGSSTMHMIPKKMAVADVWPLGNAESLSAIMAFTGRGRATRSFTSWFTPAPSSIGPAIRTARLLPILLQRTSARMMLMRINEIAENR